MALKNTKKNRAEQWHVSTEEPLERAGMKPFSKVVKQRKWEMIGYIYYNTGPKQRLQHSHDLGTSRKQKKKKTKDELEVHGWKRKKAG